MKRAIFTAAVAAVIAAASAGYAITADEALANFRSRMYGIGALSGVISWSYDTEAQYTGAFKYMPGKIYVKFGNPSGKTIVCNGRRLWIYSSATNICGIQDVGGNSGGIAGLLAGYMGIVTAQGGGGYTLKLKKPGAAYEEVVLTLDQSFFLKRAMLKDASGKTLRVSISNVDSGSVLPSHFEFNPPANTQIVKNPLEIR